MTVLSHFTLSRNHPIADRVRLAAANGFDSIGLYVGQYRQLEDDGFAPGGLRELLDQHRVTISEIEVIPGFGRDGVGGEIAGHFEDTAFRMADEFDCRYLQVIGPAQMPVADAGRVFGGLCDRAADHGLVVGLEFLPFTDVVSVDDARRVVEAAQRPNGGICVDIWHHTRGANDLAAIAALPGELITGIQLSDGTLRPPHPDTMDYKTDCLTYRVPLGEGQFDIAGFFAALGTAGAAVPMSAEVCSAWGWEHPDEHIAAVAASLDRWAT
jgi:sugar phosphate isomerase/epimerase